jgi:uncharacterized protein
MGLVDRYPHGTMCWVDLEAADLDGAKRFYRELYGWEMEEVPGRTTAYTMCRLDGKDVAGIYEQPEDQREMAPPHWNTFIAVDDLDAATKRARELGARVVAEPFPVGESGRMSVLADPSGAFVSLWQSEGDMGARVVNEPNTWTWCDLSTRDTDAAREFYSSMFGWQFDEVGEGYFSITLGDLLIGGMRDMAEDPPETPPNWMPYFVVERLEDALARAEKQGGTVIVPPRDVPAGRFAVFADSAGVFSSLFEMGPEGPARGVNGS